MRRSGSTISDVADDVRQLWLAFKKTGCAEARERLILHYVSLVRFVVRRDGAGVPRWVERDDLVSYGVLGLIEAVDRFDHTRGVRFESYAVPRIRGAMLDGLRALDWVPKSIRSQAREVDSATRKLESELRRGPSDEELARELGTNVKDIRARIDATATRTIVAFDGGRTVGDEDEDAIALVETLSKEDAEQPGSALEALETRASVLNAIAKLGKRERLLIALFYFEGFSLTRIGEIFGVTVSRASQIHSKALLELRHRVSEILPAEDRYDVSAVGA